MAMFSPNFFWGDNDDEHARVAYYIHLLGQCMPRRVNFETQWRETSALGIPEYQNTFTYGHVVTPGQKWTQFQLDSHFAIAGFRFMSVVESLAMPHTMMWSKIKAGGAHGKEVMKDRAARLWFEDVTKLLWCQRYKPEANFLAQNQTNLLSYGFFGNMGMRICELDSPLGERGLSYRSVGPGEVYIIQNHQGIVDAYIHYFKRTARQAYQIWGEKIPPILQAALAQNSQQLYNFMEVVHPRRDWVPWEMLSPKGKPFSSCYISIEGHCILEESGYRLFPMPYGRYMQMNEEEYGRGPGQMALASGKTKNAVKGLFLSQGQLAGAPAYLIGDDGLLSPKLHSNAMNYTEFKDGKPQVAVWPTGQMQYTETMMAEEDKHIDASFLVDLFAHLWDEAKKGRGDTAREVVENIADRALFLSPALGPLHTGYIGPTIVRELDILSWLRLMPPMPPVLKEARGEYEVVYTSPLARAVRNQEVAGAMQTVEWTLDVANKTGNQDIVDIWDFDEMVPEVGEIRNVPERWFSEMQARAKARQARAQAAQQEQQAKMLPGQAAIMKAQAINTKAQTGGNIGGTLSGVPSGGMPLMPGRPGLPGAPGRPGIPGQPGGY